MPRGKVGFGPGGVGAGEGVEFGFLVGSEVLDSGEFGALELALLVGVSGGAVAFEVGSVEDFVSAGFGLGLFDDLLLGDGFSIEVDEGNFFAFEPAGFGSGDAFDASDGEFAGPETMLGKGNESGADGFGLDEGEDGGGSL